MSVSVVAYGLGPIGIAIAARLVDQVDIDIVAGVEINIDQTGPSLGALLGRPELEIPILEAIPKPAPPRGVLVQATVSRLSVAMPQLQAAIRAGWNVISTCEELVCPWADRNDLVGQLDLEAKQAGVSVLGAGINPGFLMDALPLVLSAVCTSVKQVRVRRVVNTNQRRLPLQYKAGVGLSVDEFRARGAVGKLGHVGLRESAELLASGLGWRVDSYVETLEPVVAAERTETALGPVDAGDALGQRQTVEVHEGESLVIAYDLEMSAGLTAVDEIEIVGEPTIHQVILGGVNGDVGTVAVISNLVPAVAATAAGLLTMGDIMPMRNRRSVLAGEAGVTS